MIVPLLVLLAIWVFLRADFIPTKLKGLIFAVLGFGLACAIGVRSPEKMYFAAFAACVGTAGIYCFFEGLKREIIRGVADAREVIDEAVKRAGDTEDADGPK
jgi:fucose 4-O-acetylase-like acetyltransferase